MLWFRDSCLRPWVSLLLTAICVIVWWYAVVFFLFSRDPMLRETVVYCRDVQ